MTKVILHIFQSFISLNQICYNKPMCFSASASFGAGAILSGIGVASLRKAQNSSQRSFASIPLLFSIQQISEGVLWTTIGNPAFHSTQQLTAYIFLLFAQVVWPIWIPSVILNLEEQEKRKRLLKVFAGIGLVVAVFLCYHLFALPLAVKAQNHHISYHQEFSKEIKLIIGIVYVFATIFPAFYSSVKGMWKLGLLVSISYLLTAAFYNEYFISVWCFFAAIISLMIYFILHRIERSKDENSVLVKGN